MKIPGSDLINKLAEKIARARGKTHVTRYTPVGEEAEQIKRRMAENIKDAEVFEGFFDGDTPASSGRWCDRIKEAIQTRTGISFRD